MFRVLFYFLLMTFAFNIQLAWAENSAVVGGETPHPIGHCLYVGAGFAVPLSAEFYTRDWSGGVHGGLGFGIDVTETASVLLDINYNSILGKDFFAPAFPSGTVHIIRNSFDDFLFLLNGKFKIVSDHFLDPYVIAGAGVAAVFAGRGQVDTYYSAPYSRVKFAFRLGVGFDLRLNSSEAIFVESNVCETNQDSDAMTGFFKVGLKSKL